MNCEKCKRYLEFSIIKYECGLCKKIFCDKCVIIWHPDLPCIYCFGIVNRGYSNNGLFLMKNV